MQRPIATGLTVAAAVPLAGIAARWLGHYLHGNRVVLHYRVADAEVLELGASEAGGLFSRALNVGPRSADLVIQVAHQQGGRAWTDGEAAGFRHPRANAPDRGERGGPVVAALVGADSRETINFDLVRRRLRRAWFDRFLLDPQRLLPGTKMPRFVDEDGYTALHDVFDGQAARQF